VNSSVGGVVQHVRSRRPCSGVWHLVVTSLGFDAIGWAMQKSVQPPKVLLQQLAKVYLWGTNDLTWCNSGKMNWLN